MVGNALNELRIRYWKEIFDIVEHSGEVPQDWCRRNGIEFEEFRQYACIFERQRQISSLVVREERKFEIKQIEGTPFVEVPFMSRKTIDDIAVNPWTGHTPSLVITSDKLHFSFYGDYTEDKIRAAMRGVLTSA